MKKSIFPLLIAIALLAATSISVSATDATVVVTGGSLSVSPAAVSFSGVTLDGTDKTSTSAFGANTWTATDARGTGVGWNLTIISTDFVGSGGAAGHSLDITAVDQLFSIQLDNGHISVIAGNTAPTSPATVLTTIPFTGDPALKFASAAATEGMGSYTLQPNFSLMIPAETYAGTYTAAMTITAVSGP
jgi:hypothetical protein